jgi:predicted DNA-binding transcriptional regulator AlpA
MTLIEDDMLLRAKDVRKRYGNASDMWLFRRLRDPASDFPKPLIIGRLRYWRLSELKAYEQRAVRR